MKEKKYGKDMPFTTEQLFEEIKNILIASGEMPDNMLDYAISTHDSVQIRDCEFDVKMDVHFGGNEGIYLYMYLAGDIGVEGEPSGKYGLGTFKTLHEDKDSLQQMSLLGANFIWAAHTFVEKNMDDFIWTGFSVVGMTEEGTKKMGYIVNTKERAMQRKKQFLEKYPDGKVQITDLATRKKVSSTTHHLT